MGYLKMPGERIVLECQKCSTRYEIFSEEDIDLCKSCGSCIQTVKFGFISPEPVDTISSEHRRNNPLMAKAKIVKMPPNISGKNKKTNKSSKKTRPSRPAVGKKFSGVTSGLGVLAFQNKSLLDNRRGKSDDASLAQTWCDEFPSAKAYTAKDVNSVRNAFNKGKHGNDVPARPVLQYDEEGNPIKKKKAVEPENKKAVKKKVSKKKSTKKAVVDDDEDDDDDDEVFDDDEE
jgi:hypothetical protein